MDVFFAADWYAASSTAEQTMRSFGFLTALQTMRFRKWLMSSLHSRSMSQERL